MNCISNWNIYAPEIKEKCLELKIQQGKSVDLFLLIVNASLTKFSTHRALLSHHSPVLKQMINKLQLIENVISFSDKHVDVETMRTLLNCLYTGKITLTADNAFPVCKAASFLQIPTILNYSVKYLCDVINTKNVVMLFELATTHKLELLLNSCVRFIKANYVEIFIDSPILELSSKSFLDLIVALKDKLSGKALRENTFHCIVRWIKKDVSKRSRDMPILLKNIPLEELSNQFLFSTVSARPFLSNVTNPINVGGSKRKASPSKTPEVTPKVSKMSSKDVEDDSGLHFLLLPESKPELFIVPAFLIIPNESNIQDIRVGSNVQVKKHDKVEDGKVLFIGTIDECRSERSKESRRRILETSKNNVSELKSSKSDHVLKVESLEKQLKKCNDDLELEKARSGEWHRKYIDAVCELDDKTEEVRMLHETNSEFEAENQRLKAELQKVQDQLEEGSEPEVNNQSRLKENQSKPLEKTKSILTERNKTIVEQIVSAAKPSPAPNSSDKYVYLPPNMKLRAVKRGYDSALSEPYYNHEGFIVKLIPACFSYDEIIGATWTEEPNATNDKMSKLKKLDIEKKQQFYVAAQIRFLEVRPIEIERIADEKMKQLNNGYISEHDVETMEGFDAKRYLADMLEKDPSYTTAKWPKIAIEMLQQIKEEA